MSNSSTWTYWTKLSKRNLNSYSIHQESFDLSIAEIKQVNFTSRGDLELKLESFVYYMKPMFQFLKICLVLTGHNWRRENWTRLSPLWLLWFQKLRLMSSTQWSEMIYGVDGSDCVNLSEMFWVI